MLRFLVALVLFGIAAWCVLVFLNAGENLLFAVGAAACVLLGVYLIFLPLFKKKQS